MQLCTMSGIMAAQRIAARLSSSGESQRRTLGCLAAQESELLTEADL